MMEKLGEPQTHLALKEMIKTVDEDNDGQISFREVRQSFEDEVSTFLVYCVIHNSLFCTIWVSENEHMKNLYTKYLGFVGTAQSYAGLHVI